MLPMKQPGLPALQQGSSRDRLLFWIGSQVTTWLPFLSAPSAGLFMSRGNACSEFR